MWSGGRAVYRQLIFFGKKLLNLFLTDLAGTLWPSSLRPTRFHVPFEMFFRNSRRHADAVHRRVDPGSHGPRLVC